MLRIFCILENKPDPAALLERIRDAAGESDTSAVSFKPEEAEICDE